MRISTTKGAVDARGITASVSGEVSEAGVVRLDRFSPALITWAAHKLAANNGAVYRACFGISMMEWRVLLHLFSEPGVTATHLAQRIGYDKGTISRTIDALYRRGLLTETLNPEDARSSHLHLTADGEALYGEILPVALEQEARLLGRLSSEEAETFVELLSRVVDALREDGARGKKRDRPSAAALRRLDRRARTRE